MSQTFTRMQGLGNRFIVLNGPLSISEQEVIDYCRSYGDKKADGLLVISPVDQQTIEMKYWNADGNQAEMCGNGLRCAARFAVHQGLVKSGIFTVNTDAGPLRAVWDGKDASNIEVQIGKATIDPEPLGLHGRVFHKVDIGNPHAVTFVDSTETAPVESLGPKIEHDTMFPHRTNVEFVEVLGTHTIRLRTWERGVGETLACGTGMAAAASVAVATQDCTFPLIVKVLGGEATVWRGSDGYVHMRGPAMLEN